ncbi:MAG: hypothetical protein WCG91_04370 [Candidatus Shapirobacteria bacterium]
MLGHQIDLNKIKEICSEVEKKSDGWYRVVVTNNENEKIRYRISSSHEKTEEQRKWLEQQLKDYRNG